jgi:hypothetical protein
MNDKERGGVKRAALAFALAAYPSWAASTVADVWGWSADVDQRMGVVDKVDRAQSGGCTGETNGRAGEARGSGPDRERRPLS